MSHKSRDLLKFRRFFHTKSNMDVRADTLRRNLNGRTLLYWVDGRVFPPNEGESQECWSQVDEELAWTRKTVARPCAESANCSNVIDTDYWLLTANNTVIRAGLSRSHCKLDNHRRLQHRPLAFLYSKISFPFPISLDLIGLPQIWEAVRWQRIRIQHRQVSLNVSNYFEYCADDT